MSKVSIEVNDLRRLIIEENTKQINKLKTFLNLFKGKSPQEHLAILNGRKIEDLIKLEIEENFMQDIPKNVHISITNRKISLLFPDKSINEIPISSPSIQYGQSIIMYQNGFLTAGGSSPAGQTSNSLFFFRSGDVQNYSLNESRKFSSIVETDDYIFIVGGMNSFGSSLSSVEVFSKDLNFVRVLNMKNDRSYPSACFFNGFVYVASQGFRFIEKLDTKNLDNQVSTFKGDWNEKIRFLGVFNDFLIVFGMENLYIYNRNETLVRKDKIENRFEFQWTQSQCTPWENGLYFKEYFTGKVEYIKIKLLS